MRFARCPDCYARIPGVVHLCRRDPVHLGPKPQAKASRGLVDRTTYLATVASVHGTQRRYSHGCRCDVCRSANSERQRAYKARKRVAA